MLYYVLESALQEHTCQARLLQQLVLPALLARGALLVPLNAHHVLLANFLPPLAELALKSAPLVAWAPGLIHYLTVFTQQLLVQQHAQRAQLEKQEDLQAVPLLVLPQLRLQLVQQHATLPAQPAQSKVLLLVWMITSAYHVQREQNVQLQTLHV
jgi:hypothetical protein